MKLRERLLELALLATALIAALTAGRIACGDESTPSTERECVVMVGGCTGFIVDGEWLVTAKHCKHPEEIAVDLQGHRGVKAYRKYVSPHSDGPAVFRLESGGWKSLSLASEVPPVGSAVYSVGYPAGNWARLEGKILGAINAERIENAVDFRIYFGHSGGPLLNDRGEVIGVALAIPKDESQSRSLFAGYSETRKAIEAAKASANPAAPRPGPAVAGVGGAGAAPAAVQPAEKTKLWYFGAKWCGPCRAFTADLNGGKWGKVLARSDDGRRIETEQLEVIYFDIDDPANLDKLRDVQAVLLKATGRRHPESIPAFYVPGRNDMQIGYASMTGCWLIDTFKAAFTSPSVPIPPRPSVAVDVELGSPQPYSRLRPIEPVPDPISTPFVPAPVPSPATEGEPAESPGIIAKIDAAANKAESALAKFRELEAALKGEPRETVDGESDKPAGWTLLGILAAIGSFYRKIKELRA